MFDGKCIQFMLKISLITLGLAYSEFGYNEQPAVTSRFLCIKIN